MFDDYDNDGVDLLNPPPPKTPERAPSPEPDPKDDPKDDQNETPPADSPKIYFPGDPNDPNNWDVWGKDRHPFDEGEGRGHGGLGGRLGHGHGGIP